MSLRGLRDASAVSFESRWFWLGLCAAGIGLGYVLAVAGVPLWLALLVSLVVAELVILTVRRL